MSTKNVAATAGLAVALAGIVGGIAYAQTAQPTKAEAPMVVVPAAEPVVAPSPAASATTATSVPVIVAPKPAATSAAPKPVAVKPKPAPVKSATAVSSKKKTSTTTTTTQRSLTVASDPTPADPTPTTTVDPSQRKPIKGAGDPSDGSTPVPPVAPAGDNTPPAPLK